MEITKLISRRNFIKGSLLFGTLLVAGGFWRAIKTGVFNSGAGSAYAAWGQHDEGLREVMNAGILAANAHNIQPWNFKQSNTSIDLFADMKRNIGTADPFFRELHISLGCVLENMVIASEAKGYEAKITYFPDLLNKQQIARIELSKATPRNFELYQGIARRRMNRGPYDKTRPVSKEILQSLLNLNKGDSDVQLFLFDSEQDKRTIGQAMVEATEAFIADGDQVRDDAKWMRQSWDTIEKQKDGITIDAQGLPTVLRIAAKMLPPLSTEQNNKFWLDTMKNKQVPTAAAFGFIAVRDLQNVQQIVRAGQLWQRIHLWGTTKGLGLHIMNQLSERRDREVSVGIEPYFGKKLEEILGDAKWKSVIQFRLGYPTIDPLPSPRRPLSEVLLSSI